MHFKIEAVAFTESSTNQAAVRNFKVDAERIHDWRKRKGDLQDLSEDGQAKRKQFVGGGRPKISEDMEEILLDWIYEQRSEGHYVSRRMIQAKASSKSLKHPRSENFKASNGWIEKFLLCDGLSVCRCTTVAQKDPSQLLEN